jgi:hypothetical protein
MFKVVLAPEKFGNHWIRVSTLSNSFIQIIRDNQGGGGSTKCHKAFFEKQFFNAFGRKTFVWQQDWA